MIFQSKFESLSIRPVQIVVSTVRHLGMTLSSYKNRNSSESILALLRENQSSGGDGK